MTTDTKSLTIFDAFSLIYGAILDALAEAKEPLAATALSIKATTVARVIVATYGVAQSDVMTRTSGADAFYEVSTATVNAHLAKRDDVVMTGVRREHTLGGRKVKHWALKTSGQRWADEATARAEADEAAKARVVGFFRWDHFLVALDGYEAAKFTWRRTAGWSNGDPIEAEVLGEQLARDEAESFARRLRISLAKAAA